MGVREVERGLSQPWGKRKNGGIVGVGVWVGRVWVAWEVWGVALVVHVVREEVGSIDEHHVCSIAHASCGLGFDGECICGRCQSIVVAEIWIVPRRVLECLVRRCLCQLGEDHWLSCRLPEFGV